MSWELLREVVEELDVSEYVDLYTEQFPRFAEAWDGLKWLLSRTPDLKNAATFVADGNTTSYRAYCFEADILAGTPEIWVIYTFTNIQVLILGIQARAIVANGDAGPAAPAEG